MAVPCGLVLSPAWNVGVGGPILQAPDAVLYAPYLDLPLAIAAFSSSSARRAPSSSLPVAWRAMSSTVLVTLTARRAGP